MTITSRLSRAEHATKAAFAKADAQIALLPDASIRKGSGLGMLMLSAAAHASFDPAAEADKISKSLADEVDAALQEIEQADIEGAALAAVADFLKGHRPLPDNVPDDLVAHAKAVKAASFPKAF